MPVEEINVATGDTFSNFIPNTRDVMTTADPTETAVVSNETKSTMHVWFEIVMLVCTGIIPRNQSMSFVEEITFVVYLLQEKFTF